MNQLKENQADLKKRTHDRIEEQRDFFLLFNGELRKGFPLCYTQILTLLTGEQSIIIIIMTVNKWK